MKTLLWTLLLCGLLALTGCTLFKPVPPPSSGQEGAGLVTGAEEENNICPYGWLQYDAGPEITPEGTYLAEDPALVSVIWAALRMEDWQTGSEDTQAMVIIRLQFDGVDIVEITPNDIATRDGLYYTVPAGTYQVIADLLTADARTRTPIGMAGEG